MLVLNRTEQPWIEALVPTSFVIMLSLCKPMQLVDTYFWCLDIREKFQITPVHSLQYLRQWRQRVNGLLHGGILSTARTITVLYGSVLLKEVDLIHRRFDA